MTANGKAADDGLTTDGFTAVNNALGVRAKTITMNGSAKTVANSAVDLGTVITSVKINGTTATVTNGVADLGTVSSGGPTVATTNYAASITA